MNDATNNKAVDKTRAILDKRTFSTKKRNISTEENILIKTKLEGVAK